MKGAVIISGYPHPLYDRLFKGWKTSQRETRTANCKPRIEKLWIRAAR